MIEDTIAKIEARMRKAGSMDAAKKEELLKLLSSLKEQVAELEETRGEHAESIRAFTELSAHEATREEKNPLLLQHALDGLASSVDGFEVEHPKLVEVVNSICHMLSNIGI